MSENNNFQGFLGLVAVIYIVISQIMALYFWWDWAQDHSFLSTFFLGPIVGEFKGLLWIFFIW
jgi:hypothetical protein